MQNDFIDGIKTHQTAFELELNDAVIEGLAAYYELVLEHNPLLHLVGPCSPTEFAIRHILESLTLLEHLPLGAKVADVGAGAGLPSIPCLLAREDLGAILIESKEKKTKFLVEAVKELGLETRVEIVNRQFEEADPASCRFVTCRALDKFTDNLPRLLKWSGKRTKLFFGGPALGEVLRNLNYEYEARLMSLSNQRYLYILAG